MLPLQHVFKFASIRSQPSPSWLCHFYRCYVRNFFTFAFIVTLSRQLFGEAIVCHDQDQKLRVIYLETACYINGTFTQYNRTASFHHSYYQWVPVMLLLQSLVWHFPFQLAWTWMFSAIDIDKTPATAILAEIRRTGHGLFWKTLLLESMYLSILLSQPFAMNVFLNDGLALAKSMRDLFPKQGKCSLDFYSGSALTEGKFICLLPFNVFYEKVFTIMYFGFWVCLMFHSLVFGMRLLTLSCPAIRRGPYREDVNRWWFYGLMLKSCSGPTLWELERTLKQTMA